MPPPSLASGFQVTVTGEVAGAQINGADNIYCKYSMNYGVDWSVLHGLEHGISQIARGSAGRSQQTFVWNYPIDVTFSSTNVFGWPQTVLSVYSINSSGKDIVQGYCSVHIPTTPGRHVRYARLYRPVSSSLCQRFMAWLLGSPPEFLNAKFVAQGRGREVTRVSSNGVIKLVFNVSTKGMAEWGYNTHSASSQPPTMVTALPATAPHSAAAFVPPGGGYGSYGAGYAAAGAGPGAPGAGAAGGHTIGSMVGAGQGAEAEVAQGLRARFSPTPGPSGLLRALPGPAAGTVDEHSAAMMGAPGAGFY